MARFAFLTRRFPNELQSLPARDTRSALELSPDYNEAAIFAGLNYTYK
jgi:hypothetical protein